LVYTFQTHYWFDLLTASCASGCTAADTVEAIIARVIGAKDTVTTTAGWKKYDRWASDLAEVSGTSKRQTAADTVDAIIAREVGVSGEGMMSGAEWKKVGSRTSVCSDNTSDTLSADEGQRDDDEPRPRRPRAEETSVAPILPTAIDFARNGCLPASSVSGRDMGIFSAVLRPGAVTTHLPPATESPASFARHLSSSKPPDVRHTLANGENLPLMMPTSSLVASVLGHGSQTLRVRDVIHSAIEENLQSSSAASAGLDNLWQLYTQNRTVLPMPRSAVAANTPTELAQDLSCRSRAPVSSAAKVLPSPRNCVGAHGVVELLHAEKSPPPAHCHYGRPPVAVLPPPIDRCQNRLYDLAEVAAQRGRVEVSSDRHRSSPTQGAGLSTQPVFRHSVHPSELDRAGHVVHPAAGSITLGTPRHLVMADALLRPTAPDINQRGLAHHFAKVGDSLPTAPQVVELAQEALRYLGQPDSSQRAVMERVMAQVARTLGSSNPSHTILMGDYVTAQQMQNQHYQQPASQRLHQRHSVDVRPSLRDQVSTTRIPEMLDSRRSVQGASENHQVAVVNNRPQLPERPQHAVPSSSQLIRRPLTAANVIDAIITHQINKEAPASTAGAVLSRLPDPQVLASNSLQRAMNVNGTVQPPAAGGIAGVDAGSRRSIAEQHLEKECSNAAAAAAVFRTDSSKSAASSASAVQLVSRAVTLGEHIDKMIQKDFNLSVNDSPPQPAVDAQKNGQSVSFH